MGEGCRGRGDGEGCDDDFWRCVPVEHVTFDDITLAFKCGVCGVKL